MLSFFRKKMKTIIIGIAVVFAASIFYGITATRGQWSGGDGGRGNVLARVNGQALDPFRFREMISRLSRQFDRELQPQDMAFLQHMALQQTVDFSLLLNAAKKNVKVSNREVSMAVDNIMAQEKFPSQKEFEAALKRLGLSYGKFKAMVKDDMLAQKYVMKLRAGVKVGPDDLREIRASHILVSTEAQAAQVAALVAQGKDFGALAKEYSLDSGSAEQNGDLGYFSVGMMVKPFEDAAFKLKVGDVSGVVKSRFGCHVIKVTDSRLRKFPGEARNAEKAALEQKQNSAYQQLLTDLRGKARIEIVSPELKAVDYRYKGQFNEAIGEYKKAIVQNPGNPYLHVALGDTYGTLGQTAPAIFEYEKAVSLSGGNPELYLILAQALKKAGRQKEAIEQYTRVSLVAGENLERHEQLLKIFQDEQAWTEVSRERAEIARIKKKVKFEKELTKE